VEKPFTSSEIVCKPLLPVQSTPSAPSWQEDQNHTEKLLELQVFPKAVPLKLLNHKSKKPIGHGQYRPEIVIIHENRNQNPRSPFLKPRTALDPASPKPTPTAAPQTA
jgi:hypothetical protein